MNEWMNENPQKCMCKSNILAFLSKPERTYWSLAIVHEGHHWSQIFNHDAALTQLYGQLLLVLEISGPISAICYV